MQMKSLVWQQNRHQKVYEVFTFVQWGAS